MWLVLANVVLICLLAALVILMLAESRELHRRHAVEAVESKALSVAYKVAAEISAVDPALHPLRSTAERGNSAELADATDRLRVAGPRERDDGHWVIELARMPRAAAGGEAPAVVAEIDVARFERLFADLGLGQRSTVSLCMLDLSPVARYTNPPQARSALGGCSMARERVEELGRSAEAGSYVARSPLDAIERASAYRRVPGVPMLVLVGLATDDDLAGWNREAASAAALALLAIGVVIGVSVFADRAQRHDDDRRRLLDAERARLRGLLVAVGDGLHVVDRDGCLVEFSDAFAAMLGSTREALADAQVMDWERHYPAAQVDHVLRTFAVGQHFAFGSVFERADGSRIDVEITAASAHIDERDLLILSARDVTGARQALQRLRASEALLERTGRIAGVGGWELAAGSGRLELTSVARRLLCLAAEARVGQRDCLRLLGRDQRRILLRAIRESWQSGRALDLELQARGPDERPRWLHCTGERSAGPDGATRLAGAIRDVTERHERIVKLQHEQALRQILEQQAAAQTQMLRERGEMLDVLAHEVRQPLNNASAAMQSALASLREMGEQAAAPRLARAQAVLGAGDGPARQHPGRGHPAGAPGAGAARGHRPRHPAGGDDRRHAGGRARRASRSSATVRRAPSRST
jgi:PAS domain S-box-containing protein